MLKVMFYKTLLLCALFNAINSFLPLVKLPNGYIIGRVDLTGEDNAYYVFEKIPYASPPVGDLRFMAPIPPKPWDGVLATLFLDVLCYQSITLVLESEDCLYLNVFSPQLPSWDNNNVLLPVAVYIHGGANVAGGAFKIFFGPDYLIDQGIVVVTLNYRLGPLGFLSTEDEVIPGNNGLKDQQLALKWVRDNIKLFGGDPDKVTVFGQSAGAASVTHHLLNKNNEGLFRAAISASGTALNGWSLIQNPREAAFNLANSIDGSFTSNNSTELLQYLQQVDPKRISRISNNINELVAKYGPVVEVEHDGAFITEKVFQLIKNGSFLRVPYFIGFNSEESLVFPSKADEYDEDPANLVPADLRTQIHNASQLLELGQRIKDYYSPNSTFQNNEAASYRVKRFILQAHLYTDDAFIRGIIKHAQLASKFSDVFLYRFAYHGELGLIDVTVPGCDEVAHAEDLFYIWRTLITLSLRIFPKTDVITKERFVRLYSNFIKYLNPTPDSDNLLQNIQWPKVNFTTSGDLYYLNIDANLTIGVNPRNEMYQFWASVYENFDDSIFATY